MQPYFVVILGAEENVGTRELRAKTSTIVSIVRSIMSVTCKEYSQVVMRRPPTLATYEKPAVAGQGGGGRPVTRWGTRRRRRSAPRCCSMPLAPHHRGYASGPSVEMRPPRVSRTTTASRHWIWRARRWRTVGSRTSRWARPRSNEASPILCPRPPWPGLHRQWRLRWLPVARQQVPLRILETKRVTANGCIGVYLSTDTKYY